MQPAVASPCRRQRACRLAAQKQLSCRHPTERCVVACWQQHGLRAVFPVQETTHCSHLSLWCRLLPTLPLLMQLMLALLPPLLLLLKTPLPLVLMMLLWFQLLSQ